MKQRRRHESHKEGSTRFTKPSAHPRESVEAPDWPAQQFRVLPLIGIALVVFCTVIIYGQTLRVSPIDYEDPFYLVHSPYVDVPAAFSSLSAVWTEPYFANFHPVTTTTWLWIAHWPTKARPSMGDRSAFLICSMP